MKRAFAVLLFLGSFGAATHAQLSGNSVQAPATTSVKKPDHPATEKQIREYFELIHLDRVMKDLMLNMFSSMKMTAPPYLTQGFWDDMNKEFAALDVVTPLIPIYQGYVSSEDMDGILAFYRTPAGQHLLEIQPAMTEETRTKFQALGMELGMRVGMKHAAEIEAAKKQYEDSIVNKNSTTKK